MSNENKIAIYEKYTLRELELELAIFKRERRTCSLPKRLHWLEEHMEFLQTMIAGKRTES